MWDNIEDASTIKFVTSQLQTRDRCKIDIEKQILYTTECLQNNLNVF